MSYLNRGMIVCLVAGAAFACGRNDSSETENVFGPDNRETPADQGAFRAVGRLDSGCTGTIVGRQLVLTAAHCVYDSGSGTVKPEVLFFQPNMRDGTSTRPTWIEYMWIGTDKPEEERAQDWAILRVADDIGTEFGTVAIHDTDFAALLPYTVSLIGYSSDRDNGSSPSMHRGCYVHKVIDGKLFHDCDAAAGVSGGPLIEMINGNPYIVGISVSEYRQGADGTVTREQYSEDYTNVAVPATTFSTVSTQIIKNVDAGSSVPTFGGVLEMVNPNTKQDPPSSDPDPNQGDGNDPNPGQDDQNPKPDQDDQNPKPGQDDQNPNPGQDDQNPNPGQDDQNPNPGQDDQNPGVNAPSMVSPDILLRRQSMVRQVMLEMRRPAGFFSEMGYRFTDRGLMNASEGFSDAIEQFDQAMGAFVYRENEATISAVQAGYAQLIAQVAILDGVTSTTLPTRAVTDMEQARLDVRELIERLNALVTI